jgi:hypothetical protein
VPGRTEFPQDGSLDFHAPRLAQASVRALLR